ncbi:MAG TPA: hypothetical protein VG367_16360 [Mucilaginibacter sp.]|jgi:hypothetical protein|nr:hypothetical protein [Mucilaginibacter sp.]
MKRIYTIISVSIFMCAAFSAGAQVKNYVSLYGGISNPTGNYASTDYNNNQSGFARKGVAFQVDGAWYIKKNFAIGAQISWQDQGKLDSSRTGKLARGYVSSYSADDATVNGYGRYHSWNALVGPQYSFTYKDFILDLRANAGLIWVTSTPETSIVLLGVPEQKAAFYQRNSHGMVFGYGGTAGLRYKLSDTWAFGIRAAYVASPGITVKNDGRNATEEAIGRLETKIPISEFQTTLGFTISF